MAASDPPPAFHELPYPIAWPLLRADDPGEPALTRLYCLLDAVRGLVKLLTLCAVSEYTTLRPKDAAVDRRLADFVDARLSLGHWIDLLRELARYFAKRTEIRLFVAELPAAFLRARGGFSLAWHALEDMVSFRNRSLAHGARTMDEGEASGVLAERRAAFDEILRAVDWIARYHLVIPEETELVGGRLHVTHVVSCDGPRVAVEPKPCASFPLREEVRRGEALLLCRRDLPAEHLVLFPLWLPYFHASHAAYDLYAYEAAHRAPHDRLSVARLLYHPTRVRSEIEITAGSPLEPVLSSFSDRFRPFIGEVLGAVGARSPRDHYFPTQRELIRRNAERFVGREDVLERVGNVAGAAPPCVLLLGPPGQGKTSCMARMVEEHGWSHHFFARDGGRNRRELALGSLLQQLIGARGLNMGVPEGHADREKAFADALVAGAGGRPLVFVLDALDESDLENAEDLDGLVPASVPIGVTFLVTSRPGPLAAAIENRAGTVVLTLEPFSLSEASALAARMGVVLVDQQLRNVWNVTSGNPLFLKMQLEELQETRGRASEHLKLRIEDCFAARLERAMEQFGDEPVLAVIGLLATAQTGLSTSDIAQFVPAVPLFTIRRILTRLSEFLLDDGGHFRFFHKRFEEFVRRELLDASSVERWHRHIIAHHSPWQQKRTRYGFRHLAAHHAILGDSQALMSLLEPAFWQVRAASDAAGLDIYDDARRWLATGLPVDELLARLRPLIAAGEASMARRALRCLADLSRHIPPQRLLAEISALPESTDFWIGSEIRKTSARLKPAETSVASGERIRIGVLNYIGHLPLFLARDLGLFERAGLAVDLLFFDGNEDRIRALAEREVDLLASTIDEVFLASEAGVPLRVVLRMTQGCDDGQVVDGLLSKSRIADLRELEGKRLAIEKDSPSLFILHHLLQRHHIEASKIELVRFRSSDDAGAALREAVIDAAMLWEPWLHRAQQETGCYLVPLPDVDVVEDVLAVRSDRAVDLADALRRLRDVWFDVVECLGEHGDQLLLLARQRFGIAAQDWLDLAHRVSYADRASNHMFFTDPDAWHAQATYTQDVLFKAGLLSVRSSPEGMVLWDVAAPVFRGVI